jgi:hypothetical protein
VTERSISSSQQLTSGDHDGLGAAPASAAETREMRRTATPNLPKDAVIFGYSNTWAARN